MIRTSMKLFTCYEKSTCQMPNFYNYICTKKNLLYLNGKNVLYPKVAEIILKFILVDKAITSYEITSVNLRTYFDISIQMCILRFIVQLRGEVSIWEVHFTLFLKPIRKKTSNNQVEILKITWLKKIDCSLLNKTVKKMTCLMLIKKKKKKFLKKKEKATRGSWNTQGSEATKNADIEKEDEQELWEWLKTLYKEFENINESKKEAR